MAELGTGNESSIWNVFGIILTLVIGILLLVMHSRTLHFLKNILFKLRLVLKNASLKEHSMFPTHRPRKTKLYVQSQLYLKDEILRSWNLKFCNVLAYTLDRYNHIFYLIFFAWCRRRKNKVYLLRPQFSFYAMTSLISVFILWVCGLFLTVLIGSIAQIIPTVLVASIISVWSYHYVYTNRIYDAFERASVDKPKEAERLADHSRVDVRFDYTTMMSNLNMTRFIYNVAAS